MALSGIGLLVLRAGLEDMVIIDPMSLEVVGSMSTPEIDRVTSASTLEVAFGIGSGPHPMDLSIIDLSSKRVLRRIRARWSVGGRTA